MRVLVTGGTGFIGDHLVRKLISTQEVTGVRVLDSSPPTEYIAGVQYMRGDVRSESRCRNAVEGADWVVHLAAKASVPDSIDNPQLTNEVNVGGTLNMLQATVESDVSGFTFASSSAVYGDKQSDDSREENTLSALSPYAASKIAGEAYVQSFNKIHNLNISIFRFFNVYGPGQNASSAYAAAIPKFISSVLQNEYINVFGDGNQTRDFIYIADVVDVLTRSIFESNSTRRPVNLTTGLSVSVNEIIGILSNIISSQIEVKYKQARAGDIEHSRADIDILRDLYPDLRLTDLATGLKETYESYGDN